jgi:DMSO/TMAO reductase YedYZ heme-binding membrane subunit
MVDQLSTWKRRITSFLLTAVALAILAAPFGLLAHHYGTIFANAENTLAVMSSLAALLAVSFLFLEVMIGSFSPLLVRVFKPARLRRVHIALGLIGLALALTHFVLLTPKLGEHFSTDNRVFFIAGPIVLVLLIFTIATALMSRKFLRFWRSIHVLNYVILIIAIVHGLVIGDDAGMLALQLLFYGYLTFIFIGFVYRASDRGWRRSLRYRQRMKPSGTNL